MAQLAYEFFADIKTVPQQLHPDLSAQQFEEYMLHVVPLLKLFNFNARHRPE